MGPQDRSMLASKNIKDSYMEKERGRVASGMQYQGKERRNWRTLYHERDVIECFRYEGNINGELFSQFVRDRFPYIFSKGNNQKGKLFRQDGDRSWNFKMSQQAMDKIRYRLFMIPPRSSDLTPTESIFHIVGVCLRKDAIMKRIKRETYEQFCNYVTSTIHNFPSDIID